MHLAMCLVLPPIFPPACFSVSSSIADHAVVLNSLRQNRFMFQWLQAGITGPRAVQGCRLESQVVGYQVEQPGSSSGSQPEGRQFKSGPRNQFPFVLTF